MIFQILPAAERSPVKQHKPDFKPFRPPCCGSESTSRSHRTQGVPHAPFRSAAAGFVCFFSAGICAAGDAILILDASGSMWGQVDGQTKISAARRAVDSILSKWKSTDRLGLMAYGHRTKGDCKDIELVVPVGAFDASDIRQQLFAVSIRRARRRWRTRSVPPLKRCARPKTRRRSFWFPTASKPARPILARSQPN